MDRLHQMDIATWIIVFALLLYNLGTTILLGKKVSKKEMLIFQEGISKTLSKIEKRLRKLENM